MVNLKTLGKVLTPCGPLENILRDIWYCVEWGTIGGLPVRSVGRAGEALGSSAFGILVL